MQKAEKIYREYFDQVYRFALVRTPSTEDAQDIVSRVFTKVVQHFPEYTPRSGATIRSWLFTILRNELADFYRRQKPNLSLETIVEEGHTPLINEYLDQKQNLQKVTAAVQNLPDRQQEMILLKYQSDFKNKEIAQLLNLDEKTISATLSRAIKALRLHLTF